MNNRPRLILYGFLTVIVACTLCVAYAYFIEPNRLVINSQEIKIKGWNPAFDGMKIVAIGDIHGGSNAVTPEKLRQIVALTNEQNPDIVVFLGDYVSERPGDRHSLKMPMSEVADGIAGLHAKYGVFAVLGNHDDWYDDGAVTKELTRVGYQVLDAKCTTIEKDGQQLRILGLKDHLKLGNWQQASDDAKRLLLKCGGTGDVVILEHSPDVLPMVTGDLAISPDLKLILAAHTHGGQVWLPLIGTPIVPSSYGQKYSYGHIKDAGVDMFVTSGVGTSVLPIRFMMPPEIAVITLRSDGN